MSVADSAATRILVLDGDSRAGLAITRSLGRAGHTVTSAERRNPSLSSVSRFAAGAATYPDPFKQPQEFVARIVQLARECSAQVVIPATEITTLLLTQNQQLLPEGCVLPFPSADAVATAASKADVLRIAQRLSIPIPRTLFIDDAARVSDAPADLAYPAVLKPSRSRVRTASGWISTSGVTYATNSAQLVAALSGLRTEEFPVLVQEKIQGPGVGVFACFQGGEPVAMFAHRRLREKPPSGGVSVLCESTRVDPLAAEYATKLLHELRWQGIAMVEFKQDLRDGSLRLMEINGRFWGSLQLAIDAGVDFPALLVAIARGQKIGAPLPYRVGVRSRWLWGDFDSLLTVLRNRQARHLPAQHPGRWRTLRDFMNFFDSRTRFDTLQPDDMRPWLLESRRWFSRG